MNHITSFAQLTIKVLGIYHIMRYPLTNSRSSFSCFSSPFHKASLTIILFGMKGKKVLGMVFLTNQCRNRKKNRQNVLKNILREKNYTFFLFFCILCKLICNVYQYVQIDRKSRRKICYINLYCFDNLSNLEKIYNLPICFEFDLCC